MLRAPRRRGPGLPVTTIVLAMLSVSTVAAPSARTASPPVPMPVFTHHAGSGDAVELVGEHDGPPPASTTVVDTTQVPPSTLASTQDQGALVPHAAGAALGLPSVPVALLAAYRAAVAGAPAGCHLPVSLLAAIGQVESGSLAGRSIDSHQRAVPGVFGPVLSGGGYAAIKDSDGGSLDGDPRWDRAVGPMQFIPGTWRAFGRDGDGDGVKDPQNVYDAAASAAAYLCLGGRDLRDAADLQSAVLSYNHSTAYVDLVLSWQLRLAGGVAERSDTGPASTDPASTGATGTDPGSLPSMPLLPTVVAAAAVPPPLVLVDRTPTGPTPAAPGPTLIPSPHPAPRPPSDPVQQPARPGSVTAAAVAAAPAVLAVDPPTEPAMMPVMTPIAVTLTPDPPAVTLTPDPPAVTLTPDPPAVTLTPDPPVVTPTPDPPAVTPTTVTPTATSTVTPTPVTPTPVTPTATPTVEPPTVATPTSPAAPSCPVPPTPGGAPVPAPPSSQSVPPEPAVEAVGCVPAQPPATPSLPVDPPSPGGAVTPPAVLATETTPTG